MLWDNKVYLFNDGFALVHAPQYQPGSTEYSVQVDHRGYQSKDSAVEMKLTSELAEFENIMERSKVAVEQIEPILAEAIAATSSDRYLIIRDRPTLTKRWQYQTD